MRLLRGVADHDLALTEDLDGEDVPPYAILSHTWGSIEEEVTHGDFMNGTAKDRSGYRKLVFCKERARHDGQTHFWVDTCCIDKTNDVEVTTAITSMFDWYAKATKCYVYLSDVVRGPPGTQKDSNAAWQAQFRRCRWLTRGWTLQELLAPQVVEFYDQTGTLIGDKATLAHHICEITGIPAAALRGRPLKSFTIEERFSWQHNRQTKKPEDAAYSLLGIFEVYMTPIYGEGRDSAIQRLFREVGNIQRVTRPPLVAPFKRASQFVERPALTAEIRLKLWAPGSKVALLGPGGVGKSQLALDYASKLHRFSPETWVFWIDASDSVRIEQSARNIGDQLGFYYGKDADADLPRLLSDRLCDERRGPWLIVIDNVDNANFLPDMPDKCSKMWSARRLLHYIPTCDHGSVLITTRSKTEALKLVHEGGTVDVMPTSQDTHTSALERGGQLRQTRRRVADPRLPLAYSANSPGSSTAKPSPASSEGEDSQERINAARTSTASGSSQQSIQLFPYGEAASELLLAPDTPATAKTLMNIRMCYVLVMLGVLVIGSSLALGLYYSIAKDRMGDGFTAAGWITAVGTLALAAPMAKHYPHCRCWNSTDNRLLP